MSHLQILNFKKCIRDLVKKHVQNTRKSQEQKLG